MLSSIQEYIQQHQLFNVGTPVLVACSGGVDSMVLCSILYKLNYKFAIAHCNFQLRAKDSDGDAMFVEDFAKQNKIQFFSTTFDTISFKKDKQISTQMAARELRYQWFEKIRKENHFHKIVTAHHLNDQIETILLNFTKGTGLQGLTGMQPKNGYIVRPMLNISKQAILQFAQENKIPYREDASNASDYYQRNKIRLHVVPKLEEINPAFETTMISFIQNMNDYAQLMNEYLQKIKQKCCSIKNDIVEIKTGFIQTHLAGKTILFHLINEYGFNASTAQQVYQTINQHPKAKTSNSQQFFSDSHRLIVDRKSIFIVNKNIERENYLLFDKIPKQIRFNNYTIQCSLVPIHEVNIKTSSRNAYFDADKLAFPLLIRYAKEADYFYPFGLSKPNNPNKIGKKKLSKYFKDEKFSLLEKENTPVLFSGEKMLWLVNHRIDDRFKISDKTKNVLKLVVTKVD
ncbi:MAG: tRNA lysidine(34) synthetase TilS [Bacteroidetes bacterium]|nr:tRNA lysidine(34) synthetase TilS [Bacteroidota bacterium]